MDSFYFVNATLGTEFECYQKRNLLSCCRVQLDDWLALPVTIIISTIVSDSCKAIRLGRLDHFKM